MENQTTKENFSGHEDFHSWENTYFLGIIDSAEELQAPTTNPQYVNVNDSKSEWNATVQENNFLITFTLDTGAPINKNDLPKVHAVLGDRECDLDSAVSALAYAYFLYKTHPADDLYVPVLNIQRSEFLLHTEVVFMLQQLNISDSSLIFRDEIDLHLLNREGKLTLTLVDHNTLTSDDKVLETAVVKIIDHHEQERLHSAQCEIVLEPVRSCTTLIVSEILQEAPELLNQQLTHLFRGAIILDCMNMTSETVRVTKKDEEILAALEQRFPDLPTQQEVYDTLQQAKFDVS
ncbi:hypothetical protein scyTo_0003528, partial [Scyliorhinus torazame]|nr:hypothetical protein [Scyliorhinus torazame]